MQKPVALAFVDRAQGVAPGKPAFVTVDAASFIKLVRDSVSDARLPAKVSLRAGEGSFPIGKKEPMRLAIPEGVEATISAALSPSGLLLTFSEPLQVLNPGIVFGGDTKNLSGVAKKLGGGVANKLTTVCVSKVGIDATGQMFVDGTVKLMPFTPEVPLRTFAAGNLPKVDLRLESLVAALTRREHPAEVDKPGKLNLRELVGALVAIIEKASFELQIDGPKKADGVNEQGADILTTEPTGRLKLDGTLVSQAGTLTGKVTGSLEGKLKLSVELAGEGGTLPSGAVCLTHKDGRLVAQAGDMDVGRAVAGRLGALVGDRFLVDTDVSATLAHSIDIAISSRGALGITLTELGAKLALKNAAATGPRLKLGLGDASSATLNVGSVAIGEQGLLVGNGSAGVDLEIAQGELGLGTGTVRVEQGALSANASGGLERGSVGFKYDLQAEGDLPRGYKRGRIRGAQDFDFER